MRKAIGRGLAAAIFIFAFAASVQAEDKLPVRVGALRSSLDTVIHSIALEEGYYAKNGLDVKVTDFTSSNGSAASEALLRGNIDMYVGSPVDVTRIDSEAIESGEKPPLVIIAGGATGMTNLVLRKDIPYKTAADLKGLRIAVSSLGSGHLVIFRYFLKEQGFTTDSLGLKLVAIGGPEMAPALLSKQIDGFIHSEPATSIAILKAGGARTLTGDGLGLANSTPHFSVNVNRAWAEKNHEAAIRLVRALTQASQDYRKLPKDRILKIFQDYIHSDSDVLDLAYEHLNPGVDDLHKMADAFWKVNISAMRERKEVNDKVKPTDIFDFDFTP